MKKFLTIVAAMGLTASGSSALLAYSKNDKNSIETDLVIDKFSRDKDIISLLSSSKINSIRQALNIEDESTLEWVKELNITVFSERPDAFISGETDSLYIPKINIINSDQLKIIIKDNDENDKDTLLYVYLSTDEQENAFAMTVRYEFLK